MTGNQRERRVLIVAKLLQQGLSRSEIIKAVNGGRNNWGAGERTIDTYIHSANERFAAAAAVWYDAEMGKTVARLNNLYALSLSNGSVRDALAVQRELSETLGLRAPAKAENSGQIRVIVEYADDPPAGV